MHKHNVLYMSYTLTYINIYIQTHTHCSNACPRLSESETHRHHSTITIHFILYIQANTHFHQTVTKSIYITINYNILCLGRVRRRFFYFVCTSNLNNQNNLFRIFFTLEHIVAESQGVNRGQRINYYSVV